MVLVICKASFGGIKPRSETAHLPLLPMPPCVQGRHVTKESVLTGLKCSAQQPTDPGLVDQQRPMIAFWLPFWPDAPVLAFGSSWAAEM